MNTPIADFVRGYEKKNMSRLHMPGHKGVEFLGCESLDITEISGADSLYEAQGIIVESENNASHLFGTAKTVYSTEGSSQCIRAMLYLAMTRRKTSGLSKVIATRNVHKAFVYAAALLDIEVEWIWPEGDMHSLCSCTVSAKVIEEHLIACKEPPIAVYITSPDYLGGQLDVKAIADVCHRYGTILAVDNAHGAYLRFLTPSQHPMDLGADICCDSAHKTLPVLTGGAYLHINKNAPQGLAANAKKAMALFGSTSPSYLTLTSLDLCNRYLDEGYRDKLANMVNDLETIREELRRVGWQIEGTEAAKITICVPKGITGIELATHMRQQGIECEYSDPEYVVCMVTPENAKNDFKRLQEALGTNTLPYGEKKSLQVGACQKAISIREAIFAEHKEVPIQEAVGRICAAPTVSCPPAIPIVVSGEVIDEEAIKILKYYNIKTIDVVKE